MSGGETLKRMAFLILLSAYATFGQAWSGILTPSRATDWTKAGISGGVPSGSWTQCGSTIAAYGSAGTPGDPATIQTAIDACTANHYVQLGAGTFYLSGSVHFKGQSNMEIRGMGANSTFLIFYGSTGTGGDNCFGLYAVICFESSDLNWVGNNGDGTGWSNGPVNWTAGYSQGTTVITLASVPNLKIGNPITLLQNKTATDVGAVLESGDTTSGNPFVSPGNGGPYATQGGSIVTNHATGALSDQAHIYTVTGCNGSTTIGASCSGTSVAVTIDPPLEETNWASALAPYATWPSSPGTNVGVKNLSLDGANTGWGLGNGYMIGFFNIDGGWVDGVRSVNSSRAHVELNYSTRITTQNSYFFLARFSTSTSYGWECFLSSDSLVQNNIFQAIAGPLTFNEGCDGHVIGYNFGINGYYTSSSAFLIPFSNQHAVNNDFNLYEGNIGSTFDGDIIHGSHNEITLFRNRFQGYNPACWISGGDSSTYAGYIASTFGTCANALTAVEIYANNRIFNVIGNVLGTSGVQNGYNSGTKPVYAIGIGDSNTGPNIVPADSTVGQTIMLWGNYDVINAGVLWNSGDVPSGLSGAQAAFANAVPGSHTLPNSFYLASKPSWVASSKPWPFIGPDVTGGNIPNVGGFAYTNQAEDCYNSMPGATSDGTLGPFPFDATACYGASSLPTIGNVSARGLFQGKGSIKK